MSLLNIINQCQTLDALAKADFQGNQHVSGHDSATGKATAASVKAHASQDKGDHAAAAAAHRTAADMHAKAGNAAQAASHKASAEGHDRQCM